MALHVLTDKDVREFRAMNAKLDRLVEANANINPENVVNQASDIYVVEVPSGGLPGVEGGIGAQTSPVSCQVVKIDPVTDVITVVAGLSIDVHNLGNASITSDLTVAKKTKFGRWTTSDNLESGTGTGGEEQDIIFEVPSGGIAGAVGTNITSEIVNVFTLDGGVLTARAGPEVVFNIGDDDLTQEDSTYFVAALDSNGNYVFGEVVGGGGSGTGTGDASCLGIVDVNDCWIGCRGDTTNAGTGSDDADEPDTLFHMEPNDLQTEADCSNFYSMFAGCGIAWDGAGHIMGGWDSFASWQTPFGFSQPGGSPPSSTGFRTHAN